MSPASQGGVEVERYIGSCLISSSLRSASHKPIIAKKDPLTRGKTRGCYPGQSFPSEQRVQYGPGGWAGAPLISMTSSPRRCNQRSSPSLCQQQQQQTQQQQQQQQQQICDQQVSTHLSKNPLSRLAIHTQGAPLILTGRFHNRGKPQNNTGTAANGIGNPVCSAAPVNSYVHNNGNAGTGGTMNAARCSSRSQRAELPKKQQQQQQQQQQAQTSPKPECPSKDATSGTSSIANIDSLSIASDESSGSNNSENSLPRIIKPRKRRKKDRKPTTGVNVTVGDAKHEDQQQSNATVESSMPVNPLKPYGTGCYETPSQLRNHRRPPLSRESTGGGYGGCRVAAQAAGMSAQEIGDARHRYAHRHVEVKVLDDNRNVVVPVQIRTVPKGYRHAAATGHHHVAVPRYLHEYGLVGCEDSIKDGLNSSCQCRYCDPSGLIWDVDQNCYPPSFFARPEFCSNHFSHMSLYLSRPGLNCQGHAAEKLLNDHLAHNHERDPSTGSGVVLRRSWSDPSSYFSEEIAAPSKDVGVIGDRGQSESGKRRTLWRGDSIGIPTNGVVGSSGGTVVNGAVPSPKGLEVSTEIITSPNGHRDLEIKFYSASPNAPAPEEDKIIFAEELDEDEEDFSDIWSYHESKLQQDFRTLLQAEE